MWMMLLHLHVNLNADDDDDDSVFNEYPQRKLLWSLVWLVLNVPIDVMLRQELLLPGYLPVL